jgi:Zn-dependent alcohol dehydrogenase
VSVTGAGIVKEVGKSINHVSPGDKVLLSYNFCGQCEQCRQGHPAYCLHMMNLNFGGTRLDGSYTMRTSEGHPIYSNYFGQSSFSCLAVVNSSCIVKVPPSTPLDLFAPLGCGMQTGAGAVFNTLNVQEKGTVAIFGTGSVGMSAVMAAKIRKAKAIIAIDINDKRLATARRLGATHVINGQDADVVATIRDICKANGVMHALDSTGVPTVIEKMIESLGTRGQAATVGAPSPGKRVSIDVFTHLSMGRDYVGCIQGESNAQEASLLPHSMVLFDPF